MTVSGCSSDEDISQCYHVAMSPDTESNQQTAARLFGSQSPYLLKQHGLVDENESNWLMTMNEAASVCCTPSNLRRRLPILSWVPTYTTNTLLRDFIAGLTVGLTAIPQGIAYAVVAGLPPQYGLYSAFAGCFMYIFFGSCKDITIGPTAIMALMTGKYVKLYGPAFSVLLTFLSGCIILLFGVLHLGFLVEFISLPVTVGFTSAAALTIASSQIKPLFGLSGSSNSFMSSLENLFANYKTFTIGDSALGLVTIIILTAIHHFKPRAPCQEEVTTARKILHNFLWLFGLAKNAIVVLIGTVLAFIFFQNGFQPFKLTGPVDSGLPPFQPPPFSTVVHNKTLSFFDMTSRLESALIAVPMVSVLEHIAIGKAFAKGKSIDATQEMIAVGLSNILGSFFLSLPTTGSFTRTAVNNASGVCTPLGGLFTGVLVLLSLSFLTSTFFFIPKATLAGVIFFAMFHMIEYKIVYTLWHTKKLDLIPLFASLLSCLLLGLEYGMLIGILVNILFILYSSARPKVSLTWLTVQGEEVLLVTPTQSLVFPAADYLRQLIIDSCHLRNSLAPVVVYGTHIHFIDSTMAKGLKLLIDDLIIRKQPIYLWRWREAAMLTCLGFDPDLAQYFKFDDSIEQLIKGPEIFAQPESDQDILSVYLGPTVTSSAPDLT
nr:PREDICTED: sodium-independent sulfate anion transporter-like isoform X1 [Bemisia tabaci]